LILLSDSLELLDVQIHEITSEDTLNNEVSGLHRARHELQIQYEEARQNLASGIESQKRPNLWQTLSPVLRRVDYGYSLIVIVLGGAIFIWLRLMRPVRKNKKLVSTTRSQGNVEDKFRRAVEGIAAISHNHHLDVDSPSSGNSSSVEEPQPKPQQEREHSQASPELSQIPHKEDDNTPSQKPSGGLFEPRPIVSSSARKPIPSPQTVSLNTVSVMDHSQSERLDQVSSAPEVKLSGNNSPQWEKYEREEQRKAAVIKLARRGSTSSEISRRLKISQEEVELIIRLNREQS
jgi:hypothetical protein